MPGIRFTNLERSIVTPLISNRGLIQTLLLEIAIGAYGPFVISGGEGNPPEDNGTCAHGCCGLIFSAVENRAGGIDSPLTAAHPSSGRSLTRFAARRLGRLRRPRLEPVGSNLHPQLAIKKRTRWARSLITGGAASHWLTMLCTSASEHARIRVENQSLKCESTRDPGHSSIPRTLVANTSKWETRHAQGLHLATSIGKWKCLHVRSLHR